MVILEENIVWEEEWEGKIKGNIEKESEKERKWDKKETKKYYCKNKREKNLDALKRKV